MNNKRGALLLIDDEKLIHMVVKAMLDDVAESIDSAYNGLEALDMMAKKDYDGIVSDINMPLMSGLKMLEEMRVREIRIPVIILTSYSDKTNMLQALRLGAVDFLEKPFEAEKLALSVRSTLDMGLALKKCDEELNQIYQENGVPEAAGDSIKRIFNSSRYLRKSMQLGLKK